MNLKVPVSSDCVYQRKRFMNLGLFPLRFQSIITSFSQWDFKQLGKRFGFQLMDLIVVAISGKALLVIVGMPKVKRGSEEVQTILRAFTAGSKVTEKMSREWLGLLSFRMTMWWPKNCCLNTLEHWRASGSIYCTDARHSWETWAVLVKIYIAEEGHILKYRRSN